MNLINQLIKLDKHDLFNELMKIQREALIYNNPEFHENQEYLFRSEFEKYKKFEFKFFK